MLPYDDHFTQLKVMRKEDLVYTVDKRYKKRSQTAESPRCDD